jgi:hypothetical protein
MRGFWQILGNADVQPWTDPDFLWSSAALAALLLLGTAIIFWVRRWRARVGQGRPTPADQIVQYRELLGRGEISPEEFEQITGVLRGRDRPGAAPPGT